MYISLYGVPLTDDRVVVGALKAPDPVTVDAVVGVLVDVELPQAEITSAAAPTPLPSSVGPGKQDWGLGSPAVSVWLIAPCSC